MNINFHIKGLIISVIFIGIAFVFAILIGAVDKSIDNHKQEVCQIAKLTIMNNDMSGIADLSDKRMLCNNDNCKNYFDNKIKIYSDNINEIYKLNCSEIIG